MNATRPLVQPVHGRFRLSIVDFQKQHAQTRQADLTRGAQPLVSIQQAGHFLTPTTDHRGQLPELSQRGDHRRFHPDCSRAGSRQNVRRISPRPTTQPVHSTCAPSFIPRGDKKASSLPVLLDQVLRQARRPTMASQDTPAGQCLNTAQSYQGPRTASEQDSKTFKGHAWQASRQRLSRRRTRRKASRHKAEQKRCQGERDERSKPS